MAANQSGRRPQLLVWVVELFSVATAASFLISGIAHALVFRAWNLDFFALATPSDVVMSGLNVLTKMLPVLLIGWACYIWLRIETLKAKAIAVLSGVVLIAARLLIERFYYEQSASNLMQRTGIDPVLFYSHFFVPGVFWIVCALGAAAFAVWLRTWRTTDNARQPWRMVTVVALFTISMAFAVLSSFIQTGFAPIGVQLERPAKALPCAFQRILWTGEKAIVVRCHVLGDVRVLHNTQDAVFLSQFPSAPQPYVKPAPPRPVNLAEEEQQERTQFQVAWLRHRDELRKVEELRQLNAKRREWRKQEQAKLNQRFGTAIDIVDRYPKGMDQALFEEVLRASKTQEAAAGDK